MHAFPSLCLGPKNHSRILKLCSPHDHASVYSPTHTRGPERDHLTGSGRDVHEVFDTPIGKVGMLICWDLAFPEAFRELIANGAKIMYTSHTPVCYQ